MEWTLHLPRALEAAKTATAATPTPSPTTSPEPRGYVLGVDEAGRGPVLGPMVYAAAFWPCELDDAMKRKGFDDSKKLSEAQRERLFEGLKAESEIGYVVCGISAQTISHAMLREHPQSLNKIAHEATAEMIRRVVHAGVDVREIFVDAVGNCDYYERVLSETFPRAKVKVCPKADALFACVSAASIAAKVSRDKSLREWTFEEPGLSASATRKAWGCGYPGDEQTKRWLQDNVDPVFGYPSVVRHSWQTVRTILEGPPPQSSSSLSSGKRATAASAAKDEEADPNTEEGGNDDEDASGAVLDIKRGAAAPAGNEARGVPVVFPCDVPRGANSISSMFARANNKRVHYFSSRGMESLAFAESLR